MPVEPAKPDGTDGRPRRRRAVFDAVVSRIVHEPEAEATKGGAQAVPAVGLPAPLCGALADAVRVLAPLPCPTSCSTKARANWRRP